MKKEKIVRTKTKLAGPLTGAESEALAAHTKMWVARALRTDPVDRDAITDAIKGLYRVSGLAEPDVFVVPSPVAMSFTYGAFSVLTERGATLPTGLAQPAPDLPAGEIEDAYAEECFRLAGDAGLRRAEEWPHVYQGGNMWAGSVCYISASRDVLGLDLPEFAAFAWWEKAAIEGGFRVLHEKFCVVSDFPEILRVDETGRPHAPDGPSHRWRDGWRLYHWRGVRIPDAWVENPGALTPAVALQWDNIEQRRCAMEILGWEKILRELNATTIDADLDPMVGTLVGVDLPGSGREKFLRVLCGTSRSFALPVPPEMRTALEAQAWTWGLDGKEFIKPEVRT